MGRHQEANGSRKRKEAREGSSRRLRVKAEKVAELKAIDPLAVYGHQCPQGMRIRACETSTGDCVTHPLGVECVSENCDGVFIGCRQAGLGSITCRVADTC